MHRLFVAIRPPEEICDLLIDAMDDRPDLRWVGDEQLHLTLRFIGEVERPVANDLAAALGRVRSGPFELHLNGLGRFERRNGGALWAAIEPKAPVVALAARIERVCQDVGLAPEHRVFHPHITIARFGREHRTQAQDFERRNAGLSSPPFAVDRFMLFESRLSRHGPHYEEVETYSLEDAAGR